MGKSASKAQDTNLLGKRSIPIKPTPAVHNLTAEDSLMLSKVRVFKQSLSSIEPRDVAYNADILYKLLRQMSTYHSRSLQDILEEIPDEDLDLSLLRHRLCSQTVMSGVEI